MKAKAVLYPESINREIQDAFFLVEEGEKKGIYKLYNADKSNFVEIEKRTNEELKNEFYDAKTGKLLFKDSKQIYYCLYSSVLLKVYTRRNEKALCGIKNGKLEILETAEDIKAYGNFVCIKRFYSGIFGIHILKYGILHDVFFYGEGTNRLEAALANEVYSFGPFIYFTHDGKVRILNEAGEVSPKYRTVTPILKNEKVYFLVSQEPDSYNLLNSDFEIIKEVI